MRGRRAIALLLLLGILALVAGGLHRLRAPAPSTFYRAAAGLAPQHPAAFFSVDATAMPLVPERLLQALPEETWRATRLAGWWAEPPLTPSGGTFLIELTEEPRAREDGWLWERVGRYWLLSRQAGEPSRSGLELRLDRFKRRDLVLWVDLTRWSGPPITPVGGGRLVMAGGRGPDGWLFDWFLETEQRLPSYALELETADLVPASADRYGAVDLRLLGELYPDGLRSVTRTLERREIRFEEVMDVLSGEMAFVEPPPELEEEPAGPRPAFLLFPTRQRAAVEDLIDRAFPPPVRTAESRRVHGTTLIRSFGRQLSFAVTDRFLVVGLEADGAELEAWLDSSARRPLSETAGYRLLRDHLGSERPVVVTSWTLEGLTEQFPGLALSRAALEPGSRVWQAAVPEPGGLSGTLIVAGPGR
ncbi:MAG: hypothetical protein HY319_22020 [Armatimonadetes bacterium]|nr:hypothetical protein [Armatimonadota bacterium]